MAAAQVELLCQPQLESEMTKTRRNLPWNCNQSGERIDLCLIFCQLIEEKMNDLRYLQACLRDLNCNQSGECIELRLIFCQLIEEKMNDLQCLQAYLRDLNCNDRIELPNSTTRGLGSDNGTNTPMLIDGKQSVCNRCLSNLDQENVGAGSRLVSHSSENSQYRHNGRDCSGSLSEPQETMVPSTKPRAPMDKTVQIIYTDSDGERRKSDLGMIRSHEENLTSKDWFLASCTVYRAPSAGQVLDLDNDPRHGAIAAMDTLAGASVMLSSAADAAGLDIIPLDPKTTQPIRLLGEFDVKPVGLTEIVVRFDNSGQCICVECYVLDQIPFGNWTFLLGQKACRRGKLVVEGPTLACPSPYDASCSSK